MAHRATPPDSHSFAAVRSCGSVVIGRHVDTLDLLGSLIHLVARASVDYQRGERRLTASVVRHQHRNQRHRLLGAHLKPTEVDNHFEPDFPILSGNLAVAYVDIVQIARGIVGLKSQVAESQYQKNYG